MSEALAVSAGDVFRVQLRVLTGRATTADYASLGQPHLILGLIITWLVGIGRSWDNPRASLLLHTGVGSIIYVFVLAAFLYGMIMPLLPDRWSYRHLLTFIALTAAPAAIYAIPVEGFLSAEDARSTNAVFLGIVAVWRVMMLWRYLRIHAGLAPLVVPLALLLPLVLIVAALSVLNLDRAVFEFMGGMREPPVSTSNDTAYAVLVGISFWSLLASPVLLFAYVLAIAIRVRGGKGSGDPLPAMVGDSTPGILPDGSQCLHIGEASPYCTKCWMNLYEARRVHARADH